MTYSIYRQFEELREYIFLKEDADDYANNNVTAEVEDDDYFADVGAEAEKLRQRLLNNGGQLIQYIIFNEVFNEQLLDSMEEFIHLFRDYIIFRRNRQNTNDIIQRLQTLENIIQNNDYCIMHIIKQSI